MVVYLPTARRLFLTEISRKIQAFSRLRIMSLLADHGWDIFLIFHFSGAEIPLLDLGVCLEWGLATFHSFLATGARIIQPRQLNKAGLPSWSFWSPAEQCAIWTYFSVLKFRKAQQWLGYVRTASRRLLNLSRVGSLFNEYDDVAFRIWMASSP